MGMFDTLHMQCPNCGQRTSEQTKGGECQLLDLELDEQPMATEGIVDQPFNCEKCEKLIVVKRWQPPRYQAYVFKEEE